MAKTPSTMLPLGTTAPAFNLWDPVKQTHQSLEALKSNQATVILFICNHCPFVKHIKNGIIQLANDYLPKGITFIGINSNDVLNYPEDSPEKMIEEGYPFPYLFDETQAVAQAYQAACTPDCYIFDKSLQCVYRGQFDNARPGNDKPVTGQDLRLALDAILENKPVFSDQKPSLGCNIKWRE